MKLAEKLLEKSTLNEGTSATLVVKMPNGVFKVSKLQYDGGPHSALPILQKRYNTQKTAELLVQKTGELRDIDDLEYYDDKVILKTYKTLDAYKKEVHIWWADYQYLWDGKKWSMI